MLTVAITEFRANIMRFLREVEQGQKLIITSHGKSIAQVSPPDCNKKSAKLQLKKLSKSCHIGDIESPIGTEWDSQE